MSLVKSVKVVTVVPDSLRHQQCYNFRKKQLETLSGLELASIPGASMFLIPPGAPCRGVNYTHLRARWGCPLLI